MGEEEVEQGQSVRRFLTSLLKKGDKRCLVAVLL